MLLLLMTVRKKLVSDAITQRAIALLLTWHWANSNFVKTDLLTVSFLKVELTALEQSLYLILIR